MVIVAESCYALAFNNFGACVNNICGQVFRGNVQVQPKTDKCCEEGGKQSVNNCMSKNNTGFFVTAECSQRCNNCQCDGRNCNELEQAGEYGCYEVKEFVERRNTHPT